MTNGSLFWVVVIAGLGGLIVLLGLLMEKIWEKKKYRNIFHFRRSEFIRAFGAWLVMIGIVVEISVASWTAYDDWKNNPRNLPISSISGYALIEIHSNGYDTNGIFNNFSKLNKYTRVLTSDASAKNNLAILNIGKDSTNCPILVNGFVGSKSLSDTTNGENIRYDLYFDPQDAAFWNQKALAANDLNFVSVWLPMEWKSHIPEVVDGFINLKINGTISKKFIFLPQTNDWSVVGQVSR